MAAQEDAKLRDAIKVLIPKIRKFRDQQINEETTKTSMIAPLLMALGWDVSNPDSVRSEYRAKSNYNPVDYALLAKGKIMLLIEAKRLGEDLNATKGFTEILANAAVTGGAEWCVLTDGDEYKIYKANVNVNADDKLFRRVRISEEKDDTVDTLSLLSQSNMEGKRRIDDLWAVQFVDFRVKNALQAMLNPEDERHKGLVRLIRNKFDELKPKDVAASLARLEVRFDSPRLAEPKVIPADVDGSGSAGGYATFRRLMEDGKPILKEKLIEKLKEAGISEGSADSYIAVAKRTEAGPPDRGNPFGFCVVESKDESGNKIITRSGSPTGGEPSAKQ
jgi:predicted type IV restriction endonuclease